MALTTDLKNSYSAKETVIGKISGSITEPIQSDSLVIKRTNVVVPVESGIKKLGDDYYFWFVSPNSPDQYSLIIKNIATLTSGKIQKVDLMQNFSVVNYSDYYVTPGVILTQEDFQIKVFLEEDYNKDIDLLIPSSEIRTLKPGENTISISISNFKRTSLNTIKIGKYNIPILAVLNESVPAYEDRKGLSLSPPSIEKKVSVFDNLNYTLAVKNYKNEILKDIIFEYNLNRFEINPKENITLKPNESAVYTLIIKNITSEGIYENINLKSSNATTFMVVKIMFDQEKPKIIENESTNNKTNETNNTQINYRCAEIEGGRICDAGQRCSGKLLTASDTSCCIGECVTATTSKSWIGYLIASLVIVILIFVYLKFYKTRADKNPLKRKISEAEKKLP